MAEQKTKTPEPSQYEGGRPQTKEGFKDAGMQQANEANERQAERDAEHENSAKQSKEQ